MNSGALVYVIGPSGSGKDSVMNWVRQRCGADRVAFAHRYITRSAGAGGENHVELSPEEFQLRLDLGLFSLHWDSHATRYGVGVEIDGWLAAGLNVVVNGSRGYLPEAARRYPDMIPALIEVPLAELERRLRSRGREKAEAIDRRLLRARAFDVAHPNLVRIDNSGPMGEAGAALLRLVLGNGALGQRGSETMERGA